MPLGAFPISCHAKKDAHTATHSQKALLIVAGLRGKNWGGAKSFKNAGHRQTWLCFLQITKVWSSHLVFMSITAKKQHCSTVAGFQEGEQVNSASWLHTAFTVAWAANNSPFCKHWCLPGQKQLSEQLESKKWSSVCRARQGPEQPGAYQVQVQWWFSVSILMFFVLLSVQC